MNDCVFCRIVEKKIPAQVVYEDDEFLAFLDIRPITPGHTLVIPKEHSKDLFDTSGEALCRVMPLLQRLAQAIRQAAHADAVNIGMNNGSAAGQEIFHAHFHVIPRRKGDGLKHWPGHEASADALDKMKEAIRACL
jgi:histidine triad (HIT) family protein